MLIDAKLRLSGYLVTDFGGGLRIVCYSKTESGLVKLTANVFNSFWSEFQFNGPGRYSECSLGNFACQLTDLEGEYSDSVICI